MTYKITAKQHIACFLLSCLIFFVLYRFITDNINILCASPLMQVPTNSEEINYIFINFVLIVISCYTHEFIHAMVYTMFGGKIRVGFKWLIYAYTQEVSNISLPSYKFLVVLIAPLVVVSTVTLLLNHWMANILFFINLIGSTGDILMSAAVIKYGRKANIVDHPKGFTVVARNS